MSLGSLSCVPCDDSLMLRLHRTPETAVCCRVTMLCAWPSHRIYRSPGRSGGTPPEKCQPPHSAHARFWVQLQSHSSCSSTDDCCKVVDCTQQHLRSRGRAAEAWIACLQTTFRAYPAEGRRCASTSGWAAMAPICAALRKY